MDEGDDAVIRQTIKFRFLFRVLPYPGAALSVRPSVHPFRSPFPL